MLQRSQNSTTCAQTHPDKMHGKTALKKRNALFATLKNIF
jgi:hypothetical protein